MTLILNFNFKILHLEKISFKASFNFEILFLQLLNFFYLPIFHFFTIIQMNYFFLRFQKIIFISPKNLHLYLIILLTFIKQSHFFTNQLHLIPNLFILKINFIFDFEFDFDFNFNFNFYFIL
jgi:hypothetical protein